MSDSLWSHGLQHARNPCPSSTHGVSSNSCPLSQWCHPTISGKTTCPSPSPGVHSDSCPSSPWYHPAISFFVVPFSSHLQSFPASGSFQMSQFSTSGGQSIGSFSFSISPSSEHSGLISSRMDWLDLLAVQGTLKSLLQHHSSKASILQCSAFFTVQLLHCIWPLEKP